MSGYPQAWHLFARFFFGGLHCARSFPKFLQGKRETIARDLPIEIDPGVTIQSTLTGRPKIHFIEDRRFSRKC